MLDTRALTGTLYLRQREEEKRHRNRGSLYSTDESFLVVDGGVMGFELFKKRLVLKKPWTKHTGVQ